MFLILSLLLSTAQAQNCSETHHLALSDILSEKQYPEDRPYTSSDRGWRNYLARSVYGSGDFALTFDDGPHETHTAKILDVLKEFDVKVTFFVITSNINAKTRPVLERALREGHILASHGVQHLNSNDLTEDKFKQNLRQSLIELNDIYESVGIPFNKIYYRYPYGAYAGRSDFHQMNALKTVSQELFGDNCIQFAFWDVDSADWVVDMTSSDVAQTILAHHTGGAYYEFESYRDSSNRLLYRKVLKHLALPPRGGVVLQHDIHEKNILATRRYLQMAKEIGIKLVELPEIKEYEILRECRFL